MSARSIKRAHDRRARRARRAGAATVAAAGAAITLASPAQAATFEVNSKLDNGDNTCDATCTIRDAVDDANADAAVDTITFRPGLSGTITLITGELPINSAMTIQGPGADTLGISGDADNDNTPEATDSRIARIETDIVGAPNEAVSISGLTVREGYDPDYGGGIYALESDLTLEGVAFADNYSSEEAGGLHHEIGDLTITDSSFTGGYSEEQGGGVYADGGAGASGAVVIRRTTMSGNYAEDGGGLYIRSDVDSVLVADSTFSDNRVYDEGGGIGIDGTDVGPAVIRNTTVSGNSAMNEGGGIYLDEYADLGARIENSTIVDNAADLDVGSSPGGGIFRNDGAGPLTISSTIAANNTDDGGASDLRTDVVGTPPVELGFSLVENAGTTPLTQSPTGSNILGVDPALGGLAANGGPTRTHLPTDGSPVVDAGISNGLATDQRGQPRTAEQAKANAAGGDGTDIGAVELPDVALLGADATAKKKQKVKAKAKGIKVVVTAGADELVDLSASGKVKAGKKSYPLKTATAEDVPADGTKKLTLKLKSKKAAKKVAKFLDSGKKAKATVDVSFTDAAGNTATDSAKATLLEKGKKGKK